MFLKYSHVRTSNAYLLWLCLLYDERSICDFMTRSRLSFSGFDLYVRKIITTAVRVYYCTVAAVVFPSVWRRPAANGSNEFCKYVRFYKRAFILISLYYIIGVCVYRAVSHIVPFANKETGDDEKRKGDQI